MSVVDNGANIIPLANCGLAVLNLSRNPDVFDNSFYGTNNDLDDLNTSSLFCAACKPGYKPDAIGDGAISGDANGKLIRNCTAIPNCNVSFTNGDLFFNGCPKCADGYAWDYTVNNDVDHTTCIDMEDHAKSANCQAWDINDANNKHCAVCADGYILAFDGSCHTDDAEVPECTNFNYPIAKDSRYIAYST